MNLVIALMVTRQFLPKSRIRDVVSGYQDQSDDAFERMFERDKHDLRELGIGLETGTYDSFFDDEEGYRIIRDDVELPHLDLTVQESALLSVAAQVWDHLGLARESTAAVTKLKSAGVDVDNEAISFTEPTLAVRDRAFDDVWDATVAKSAIRFQYRRPRSEPSMRHVQPWAVLSWHGLWYLIGFDIDRDDTRSFRLSRVIGEVHKDDSASDYQIPADLDVQALAERIFADPGAGRAHVLARTGKAVSLRHTAVECVAVDDDTDRLTVAYWDGDQLAGQIAGLGADVFVEGPAEVRDKVISRLRSGARADDVT